MAAIALGRDPQGWFSAQPESSLLWDLAWVWPPPRSLALAPWEIPSDFTHLPVLPLTWVMISGSNFGRSLDSVFLLVRHLSGV